MVDVVVMEPLRDGVLAMPQNAARSADCLFSREIIEDFVAPEKAGSKGVIVIGIGRRPHGSETLPAEPIQEGGILGLEKFIGPPTAEANGRPAYRRQFT